MLKSVNTFYFLLLLMAFIFGMPFLEFAILLLNSKYNGELVCYLVCILFSFASITFIFRKKYFKSGSKPPQVFFKSEKHDVRFQQFVFLTSVAFFTVFLSFIIANVHSITDLAIFSERYRNSAFKGSGLYTIGITKIVPIFIVIIFANASKIRTLTYLSLIMVLIASFVLGFRVYLLGIFIFLSFRLLNTFGVRKALFFLLPFLVFMLLFKIFLNNDFFEMTLSDRILNIAGRTEYRNLLENWFFTEKGNFASFIKYLPGVNWFTGYDVSTFKEEFVHNISNVSEKIPYINLYSGVAIPIMVIFYNHFGILSIIPCVLLLLVVAFLSFQQLFAKSPLTRITSLYLFLQLFGCMVEDVDFISNLVYIFILVPGIYFIFRISSLRIHI